ncbi:MAG: ABC transporter permease subunit [Myxococcota bacterium]
MIASYIARRLLLMIPTLVGISLLVFILTQIIPGGPVEAYIRQLRFSAGAGDMSIEVTEELLENLKKMYGYDKPAHVRYFTWMGNILRGDLGISHEYQEPVSYMIRSRLPVSLTFGIFSFFLVYLISIPLGIFKAIRDGTHFDAATSITLFVMYSIPSYALATLCIVFLCGGSFVSWFPLQGLVSEHFEELSFFEKILDYLHHITLPLICYVLSHFALTTMMMKNSFLEQVKQDYVRTARSKGLPEQKVYFKHVLRNALIPIATELSSFTSIFLSGSILIEQIFGLDGIGLLNYESILARDYPLALGIIMTASVATVLGVFLSDLLYVLIDPRITYQ